MALVLGDNFSYQGSKPLDARLKYDTIASMKAVADATLYDGCMAYVTATKKNYQWDSANEVDETLGKWRELETGGGGHAIEDSEGTALTQRETMQFGDGFNASDDSTNEKTVVEPNLMTAADMDDVVTPLPSVQNRYHKYSTEEQIVGEWIDGKPLYQKTIDCGALPNATSKVIPHNISNIDKIIDIKGTAANTSGALNAQSLPLVYEKTIAEYDTRLSVNETSITFVNQSDRSMMSSYVTIQYTKTT